MIIRDRSTDVSRLQKEYSKLMKDTLNHINSNMYMDNNEHSQEAHELRNAINGVYDKMWGLPLKRQLSSLEDTTICLLMLDLLKYIKMDIETLSVYSDPVLETIGEGYTELMGKIERCYVSLQ